MMRANDFILPNGIPSEMCNVKQVKLEVIKNFTGCEQCVLDRAHRLSSDLKKTLMFKTF